MGGRPARDVATARRVVCAHAAVETTLFNMTHLGCTVPPNAETYWVGDAGPVRPTSRRAARTTSTPSAPPGGWGGPVPPSGQSLAALGRKD